MSAQTGQMDSFNCERVCSLGINAYFLLYFLSCFIFRLFIRKMVEVAAALKWFYSSSKQALCPCGTSR
uniref:Uncharacterized protein n=1 Tax=Anguilla anguilla TaxID=7936 RepID=A0A0E9QNT4_ANGAN